MAPFSPPLGQSDNDSHFVPVATVIRIITPPAHSAKDSCGLSYRINAQRVLAVSIQQKCSGGKAEKTERPSGALTPNAKVIVSANNNSINPLNNAATRGWAAAEFQIGLITAIHRAIPRPKMM